MQDSTSLPRLEKAPTQWNPLVLPALVLAGSLVVGLVVFMVVWRIPTLREGVTHSILAIPRPVWLVIVALILIAAIISAWLLLHPYLTQPEEEKHEVDPSPAPATPPPYKPRFTTEQRIIPSGTPGTPVQPSQANVIDPTTPIPEAAPNLEQILQRPAIARKQTPTSALAAPRPAAIPEYAEEAPTRTVKPETLLTITLLKEVTLTLHLPGNRGTRQIPINAGTKRAQLLAYLAVRRGELVHRSKILYHIFAWRREDGTTDDETMSGHFHSHARLLRNNIRETIQKVNEEAGEQIMDPDLDPFKSSNEYWGISSICEVVDIEEVEQQHKIIEIARKEGLLTNQIPLSVKEACERLIAAYPGDFIEDLIRKSTKDFKPWEGKASWAKRYTTHFRSCFLDAKWLLGVYEEQQAQACAAARESILKEETADPELKTRLRQFLEADALAAIERRAKDDSNLWSNLMLEELERQQRIYYGRAIEPFKTYALTACSTPYYAGNAFDEKVGYNATTGRFGDRIGASEQALRRCFKAYAFTGDTREASEVYSAYENQMTGLFRTWGRTWAPSQETIDEWESVRALTDAHRFSAHIPSKQAG